MFSRPYLLITFSAIFFAQFSSYKSCNFDFFLFFEEKESNDKDKEEDSLEEEADSSNGDNLTKRRKFVN
jgi:hypothetical protein